MVVAGELPPPRASPVYSAFGLVVGDLVAGGLCIYIRPDGRPAIRPAGRPSAPSKMKFPIVFRMRAAGAVPEFKPLSGESAISSAYPRDANSR